jgi:hypothetical protein
MHCGSIENNTAAAKVYRILRGLHGQWIGGWELTVKAEVTAVSTRVSEIRRQLPPHIEIQHRQRGRKHFYRVIEKSPADA